MKPIGELVREHGAQKRETRTWRYLRYLFQIDAAKGIRRGLEAIGVEVESYTDAHDWPEGMRS